MRVNIMGRRYGLEFVRPQSAGWDGECDPPDARRKSIRINRSLTGKRKLETIVHEFSHAAAWWLSEEHVAKSSKDLAEILWLVGYRHEQEEAD